MNNRRLITLIVSISLGWAASAHADAVTYWNAVTAEAVTAGRPGGAGFLDMALVHAAMHDAVQAIQQRFEPYAATLKGSGSLEAAAGAAAYGVLVGIYPKQQGSSTRSTRNFSRAAVSPGTPAWQWGSRLPLRCSSITVHRPRCPTTRVDRRPARGVPRLHSSVRRRSPRRSHRWQAST